MPACPKADALSPATLLARLGPPFEPFSLTLGLSCGLLVAFLLCLLIRQQGRHKALMLQSRLERLQEQAQDYRDEVARLTQECRALTRECRELDVDNAALQSASAGLRQQLAERDALLAETRRQIEAHFQATADRILHQQNESLSRKHQSSLNLLLQPLHEQIGSFRERLETLHREESRERSVLQQELDQLRRLNQQLSNDAVNLSEALRGKNKFQGQWGELVLSRVLEASGLRAGQEFDTQPALHDENGGLFQPDAVVHLPEGREVLIDAKMSLKDYTQAVGAGDPAEAQAAMQRHLASVKRQIGLLAGKRYHTLMGPGALDFVLLFIPVEGAFQAVVAQAPHMLTDAMRDKVVLASPSTLLAILRTIHHLWRVDEQHNNSLAIAKQAASIYDKLAGFVEAFDAIGLRLQQTELAWRTARNRLHSGQGNLLARAEALKELGVQPNKELHVPVENSPPSEEISI